MGEYGLMFCVFLIIDNWVFYYVVCIQVVMDGIWFIVNIWDGIDIGMVEIGEIFDVVLVDVKVEVLVMVKVLGDGSYYVFIGLINKQDGFVWLVEGEIVDDGMLVGMFFYVEGIVGDILN